MIVVTARKVDRIRKKRSSYELLYCELPVETEPLGVVEQSVRVERSMWNHCDFSCLYNTLNFVVYLVL
jgi:hypothetical protein